MIKTRAVALVLGCAVSLHVQVSVAANTLQIQPFSSQEESPSRECESAFLQIDATAFEHPKSLGSDSAIAAGAASASLLLGIELVRSWMGNSNVFGQAFRLTVVTDVLLTIVTMSGALREIPIQKIRETMKQSPAYEFAGRSILNMAIGNSAILASWKLEGVEIDASRIAASVVLCAAVYPTLQLLRQTMFKDATVWMDSALWSGFTARRNPFTTEENLAISWIEEQITNRAQELNIDVDHARKMNLAALQAVLLAVPIEEFFGAEMSMLSDGALEKLVKILRIRKEIEGENKGKFNRAKLHSLTEARLAFRMSLLHDLQSAEGVAEETRVFIHKTLSRGWTKSDLAVDEKFVIDFHEIIFKRHQRYWKHIVGASALDQIVSVGIAGGIFLRAVHHYATTGQWF